MDTVTPRATGATLGPEQRDPARGARIGAARTVGPVSLVMRGESVPDKTRWIGNPIATLGRCRADDVTGAAPVGRPLPARPRRRRLRRRALRPRPRLQGRRPTASTAGPHAAADRDARTSTELSLDLHGLRVAKVHGRRRGRGPVHPRGRHSCASGCDAGRRRRRAHRRRSRYARPAPRRCRGPGATSAGRSSPTACIVAAPAARRAVLVPVQRPPGRQGDLPDRRDHRPPATTSSPTARSTARRRRRPAGRRGSTSSPSRWRPTSPPCRSGATSSSRSRRAGPGAQRRRSRPGCAARPRTTSAGSPRCSTTFSAAVRALPVRRLHRRRHRRRPGDPARGAGPVDLRRQPPRRAAGTHERLVAHELAHQWFGNSLTVAALARHLAARGLRLLRRVAVVGGVRRHAPPQRAGPSGTTRGWPRCRRTSCSPTPGRDRMFDDRVYKRGALHAARAAPRRRRRPVLRAAARLGRPAPLRRRHHRRLRGPGARRDGVDPDRLLGPWLYERALPPLVGAPAATSPDRETWVIPVAQPTVCHPRSAPAAAR